MLARALHSLRTPLGRLRAVAPVQSAFFSSHQSSESQLVTSEPPVSTALEGSKAADVAARLEAMETEQLGLIPHHERMQQMGNMIQNEYVDAGLNLTDITVGNGAEAVPGTW